MGKFKWINTIAAAAAFTAVGLATKPSVANAQVKATAKKVQVIKKSAVYNNYENGKKTGKYIKKGKTQTVYDQATDQKSHVWIKVGKKTNKWIKSQNTMVVATETDSGKTLNDTAAPKSVEKKAAAATNNAANTATQQPASSQAPITENAKQKAVVNLAKAQVGKAYVWGGVGPSSFDCSGLVQWVYKNAVGIDTTRTTYTQVNQGSPVTVSTATLQPGDLIFWGSAAAPYHVAIYIGNGQYVSAADETQGVILATLSSYYWPVTARRLL